MTQIALTSSLAEGANVAVGARLGSRKDDAWMRAVGAASEVGDQPPLIVLCGVVGAYGLVAGSPRVTRAGIGMFGALLLAVAAKTAIKELVSRTRPNVLLDEGRYEVVPLGPRGGPWKSFPSGHTAGSVAVARAATRAFPQHRWSFYGAAAAVGLAQVPRGAHYPADVIAGALIGVAADMAAQALWRRLPPRRSLRGEPGTARTAGAERGRFPSREGVATR